MLVLRRSIINVTGNFILFLLVVCHFASYGLPVAVVQGNKMDKII
jgi:hypothetical protein